MILGIGTDIVEIERIAASIERLGERFVDRILTPSEREQFAQLNNVRAAAFLAKRFAAKEAAVKALGTGIGSGVSFQHFTVVNLPSGKPTLEVDESIQGTLGRSVQWHLSLSDEQQFALAFVTLEAME
ncbi:Holo-[acyl-carrier-protein] synthase [Marinomonas aquimarina]|uniref:Holo-[acyl-carrier-protein] synthase n=1 Tax=Marinomonas aquimarina TaxID=295068 RepID=A0A1A8TMV3_9GAMM|nr:holo-ACP synthase [Marinomonas aquimarina]SBS35074.1 Holo-[acyl-carrier-protein] synthase [Marinomonas aquimarina]